MTNSACEILILNYSNVIVLGTEMQHPFPLCILKKTSISIYELGWRTLINCRPYIIVRREGEVVLL
jgi:hypothetical protein